MRNLHENNEPAEAQELRDQPHVMLPPLAEGFRYEFATLQSGRTVALIKKNDDENSELERAFPDQETEREKFERRYHG